MITAFHPDLPYKTYKQEVWWSDKWDPKSYGREYDFSRSFFEQYHELMLTVPLPGLQTEYSSMINSEYCNGASELRNCYLAFKIDYSEDCAYTNIISRAKQSFEIAYSKDLEYCYEVFNLVKCFKAFYSRDCVECHDVYFSQDLVGCSDCIGCVNLVNRSYCIFNEQYSKEEYEKKLKEFDFGSHDKVKAFRELVRAHVLKYPRRNFHGRQNVNTSGDYIYNSKNVHDSFLVSDGENVRYSEGIKSGPARNCYDQASFGLKSEWVYDSTWIGLTANTIKFSVWNYGVHDLDYCFGCHGSGNLFGCIGLRKAEYCILNKQYTKEEYEELLPKIKKQMMEVPYVDPLGREYRYGEMLPVEFSPWAWNETTGYEILPFTKEEALKRGLLWRDEDKREYREATMAIPDHIKDATDDILKAILKCEDCGKNYQVIPMELQFMRRFNLPIRRTCPLCRDRARMEPLKHMLKIYERTCAKCQKTIQTSYAPDRPEIVYCEQCYQQEVV